MSRHYLHDSGNYLNKDHVFHQIIDKVFVVHLSIMDDVLFLHHLQYYLKVDQYRIPSPLVLKSNGFSFF